MQWGWLWVIEDLNGAKWMHAVNNSLIRFTVGDEELGVHEDPLDLLNE